MVYLLAAALSAGLLYFWLAGHWFGRVLAFLALAPIGVVLVAALALWSGFDAIPGAVVPVWIVGGIIAWLASGLPHYVTRWQTKFRARRYPEGRLRLSLGD